jgi:hypothetical protein
MPEIIIKNPMKTMINPRKKSVFPINVSSSIRIGKRLLVISQVPA